MLTGLSTRRNMMISFSDVLLQEQPFQSAKKCLRYLVVLQRLPYAAVKMQRSLQYQVVSALLQRIIISLMTHLEESMTKIVPVLLPTERNKNKKVRQDFAVMALAVVIHVTESLANLHGSASMDVQNTVSFNGPNLWGFLTWEI